MPELPEVEVTRRSFAPAIEGARVLGVRLGKPLRWPLGMLESTLLGQRVLAVERRAKYLLLPLESAWLIVHLGMSGSLRFASGLPPPQAHDHFDLVTEHGTLRLHDPRRFGAVVAVPDLQHPMARKLLAHLGPEPFSNAFNPKALHQALQQRQTAIKPALMRGDLVVGVGNIYANEALFAAGIRPTVAANRLSLRRATRLHEAVVAVLARAVERGGSTLQDFSAADGQAGHFQLEVQVYGRAGQPCRACGAWVRQIVQAQRSSYFCPRCQRS